MNSGPLAARVTSVITRALHLHNPGISLRMGTTPGWDSLGHMTVILELEREFAVRVPVGRIPELVDVDSIVAAIEKGMK